MIENPFTEVKSSDATVPLQFGCEDKWHWNKSDKSHEVVLYGPDMRIAHFHPKWSNGTAAVRGSRPLNRCPARYYWEIHISDRIFGTSMMFGVTTKSSRLHADTFLNMIGEDQNSFGLSHKGLLWHNGQWQSYTRPFRENESTTVGLLFDSREGTLTYFKDGVSLGTAFTGLYLIKEDLYPVISSTAAKTEMRLKNMRREYYDLQDRCRDSILKSLKNRADIMALQLPKTIRMYLGAENQSRNNAEEVQQIVDCSKNNSVTHFRQSLYSCADSHNLLNFYKNPSNTPFLEL